MINRQMRPVMTDQSQKTSSFNPDFINRVSNAMLEQEYKTELENRAKIKAGKPLTEPYRGYSDADTSVTQRIVKATFQPENNSTYRQQVAINEFLKQQARQLKEDAARNAQYAKELKKSLQAY